MAEIFGTEIYQKEKSGSINSKLIATFKIVCDFGKGAQCAPGLDRVKVSDPGPALVLSEKLLRRAKFVHSKIDELNSGQFQTIAMVM